MKLLVLDGNSIINRAFYGIRLLSTKDGQYTNAIVGFLNILNKARDETAPDAVAVAFDLPAPTFRHLSYDGYKAGRKKMPDELASQLPVLKDLLRYMGLPILEAEGFEADDILGTEAYACAKRGDACVLLTGDRDSFQLVGPSATVRLASTKAGQPVTTLYDEAAIRETYGVEPRQMIDVKALMGDTSDNIPGVAGVGEKTALSLIRTYGTLDEVYAHLEDESIRPALRAKLRAGKESAYMSRKLAKISTDAPVETDPGALAGAKGDSHALALLMARLELFKLMEKMGVTGGAPAEADAPGPQKATPCTAAVDGSTLLAALRAEAPVDFACRYTDDGLIDGIAFTREYGVTLARAGETAGFDAFLAAFFADGSITKRTHDSKPVYAAALRQGFTVSDAEPDDTMLLGYLLNPLASSYAPARLCEEYTVFPPPPKTCRTVFPAVWIPLSPCARWRRCFCGS
ncbi:5'-3' exonuclease H3TH domain-containing protein [Ethanoligenens harbinense]|uniref:5'-3' exonuclease H3TH domain-containing protein n=1 Tax=Ethanoligenens harbinense TaxID=253239 RepID=UPI003119CB09